jgi:hypothetical protein
VMRATSVRRDRTLGAAVRCAGVRGQFGIAMRGSTHGSSRLYWHPKAQQTLSREKRPPSNALRSCSSSSLCGVARLGVHACNPRLVRTATDRLRLRSVQPAPEVGLVVRGCSMGSPQSLREGCAAKEELVEQPVHEARGFERMNYRPRTNERGV